MKILATVAYPVNVEIDCDDNTSDNRIRELIFIQADKEFLQHDRPQIISCLKVNEQCPEENEELTSVLG